MLIGRKRKLKRFKVLAIFAIMLISAIFCGTLVACNGGDGDDTDKQKVTITYYIRQDGAPLTAKAKYGEEFRFSLNNLKRPHYTYAGMYEDPNGYGQMIIDESGRSTIAFTEDITLYVHWLPSTYTLEFDAGEGSIRQDERTKDVVYGGNVGILPQAELEGYEFDGWFLGETRISTGSLVETSKATLNDANYVFPDSGNIVLTARYKIKKFTITFNYNDGRAHSHTIEVEYGQEIPEEAFPEEDTSSKLIYAWSTTSNQIVKFEGTVTSEMTFYAFWKYYKVFKFFNMVDEEPTEVKVFQNEPYTPETLSGRNGYTFSGWYNNELYIGDVVSSVSYGGAYNEFYAKWKINNYALELETNGGECSSTIINYNIETDDFDLPVPQKDNYTFIGWYQEEDFSGECLTKIVKGTYDVTKLYAKYKGEDKTLILDADGGNVSQSSKVIEYGTEFELPVPKLDEYVFIGWYDGATSSANKITGDDGKGLVPLTFEDLETTLYAHYMEKLYITVQNNLEEAGGTSVKEYYLEGDEVRLIATLNSGYTFLGWYENHQLVWSELEYEFTMGASYVDLELKYKANVYTVNLNAGDGECEYETFQITYNTDYTLPVATKPDYKFIGWKHNSKFVTDINGNSREKWNKTGNNITLKAEFVLDDPNSIFVFDPETLLAIKNNPSASYSLVAEIDMTGYTWTPFDFSGTLKGNGLSINNLTITSSSGNLGVFNKFSGTIQNLEFNNLSVTSTSYNSVYVGGICAEMTGGTIDNVTVKGSVVGDFCRIGGFAGKVAGGTISNSSNYASVISNTYEEHVSAGGITGHFTGGTISHCENRGDISIKKYGGGIIGYATATGFQDVSNYGTVTGEYSTGGIVGLFSKSGGLSMIARLENYGEIRGGDRVGGIYGFFSDAWDQAYNSAGHQLKITNAHNEGAISGKNYVAGIIGYVTTYTSGSGSNGSVTLTMNNLTNEGDVIGVYYVGGIVGYAYSDNSSSMLANSTSNVDITAEAYVGGIAGRLENVKLVDCSNAGTTINATRYVLDGTTYYGYVGGYVGFGHYVEGLDNAVEINYGEKGIYVGGIAGRLANTIKECNNTANISAEQSNYVGGLVGFLNCNGGYDVALLTNTGNVKGNNCVGGIAGEIYDGWDQAYNSTTHTLKLTTLTNEGNVDGNNNVGGIVGNISASTWGSGSNGSVLINMNVLKNTGDVTGINYVGGLLGKAYSDNGGSSLTGSSSTAKITAEAYVGGLAGRLENIKLIDCSNKDSVVTATGYVLDGTTYYAYVGGYVGFGYYVEGCDNEVEITYTKNGIYVGGIAGRLANAIKKSSNKANVSAINSNYVGGLVGDITCTGGYEISVVSNSGNVEGKTHVGGILGRLYDGWDQAYNSAQHTVKIMSGTNTGTVKGTNYVGGMIGELHAETWGSGSNGSVLVNMSALNNSGDITGVNYVGGLIGLGYSDTGSSIIEGCTSSADIIGEACVGGLAGKLQNIKLVDCSNENSTLSATGYILEGTTYYAYVGGYVGFGYYVEGCDNEVAITYAKNGIYVGGIAGKLAYTIKRCENNANISAVNSNDVGGLVGNITCAGGYELSTLKNSGNVEGKEYVGGILGRLYDGWDQAYNGTTHTLSFTNITNSGAVSGSKLVGGIVGDVYANTWGNGNNGSVLVNMNEIHNSADVSGETTVGGLFGSVNTDNGSSSLNFYTCTGMVNGSAVTDETLIISRNNFAINTVQ